MLTFGLFALVLALPVSAQQRSPAELLAEIRAKGNGVPNAVFEELAKQRSREALDALIAGLGSVPKVDKQCVAYKSFVHFKGVPEVEDDAVEFLAERAQGSQEKLALHATYRLGALWPAAKQELVELTQEHKTADGRSVALMHLVEHDMPLSSKQLKRLARSDDDAVRYEACLAATARLADDGERARAIGKQVRSRDSLKRLVAVEMLATEPLPDRFVLLRERLSDEDGRVARKALSSLTRTRDRAAVEILIARISEVDEGSRFRISRALQTLTGQALGVGPDRWQRWWKAEGETFEVPGAPSTPTDAPEHAQATSSFYGLPIYSTNLVFAIDTSDSMKQPSGKKGSEPRIVIAKRELNQALESLPEASRFDIVNFGKRAWSWKGELVAAKPRSLRAAQKHVEYLELSWGTEIYYALREAFRDPSADTILFMTDGDPQLSLMQDRAALQRIVKQWNRTRHTTIDCLSIGTDRGWLAKLAEQSGGRYVQVE